MGYSHIVLVEKNLKDGGCRFCVDYHRMNAVTKMDAFPLPCIDATLDLCLIPSTLPPWIWTLDNGMCQCIQTPRRRQPLPLTLASMNSRSCPLDYSMYRPLFNNDGVCSCWTCTKLLHSAHCMLRCNGDCKDL